MQPSALTFPTRQPLAGNSNVMPLPPRRDEAAAAGIPVRSKSAAAVVLAGRGATAQVLLMQRAGKTSRGLWSLVMGGLEAGETAPQAARRELMEEAGIEAGDVYNSGCCDTFYNPGANTIDVTPNFIATFAARPAVTLSGEHLDYRWVGFAEAMELIAYPGQRQALAEIKRDFADRDAPAFRRVDI